MFMETAQHLSYRYADHSEQVMKPRSSSDEVNKQCLSHPKQAMIYLMPKLEVLVLEDEGSNGHLPLQNDCLAEIAAGLHDNCTLLSVSTHSPLLSEATFRSIQRLLRKSSRLREINVRHIYLREQLSGSIMPEAVVDAVRNLAEALAASSTHLKTLCIEEITWETSTLPTTFIPTVEFFTRVR
jgi:hypothetical protein